MIDRNHNIWALDTPAALDVAYEAGVVYRGLLSVPWPLGVSSGRNSSGVDDAGERGVDLGGVGLVDDSPQQG